MTTVASPRDPHKGLRLLGRLLTLLWAGFWIWFGIASSMGERETSGGTFMHILPGLAFFVIAVLTFTWQTGAAILLIAIGLAVGILYPLWATAMPLVTIFFIEMAMAIPPLVAGILLLLGRRRKAIPISTPPPSVPPPSASNF